MLERENKAAPSIGQDGYRPETVTMLRALIHEWTKWVGAGLAGSIAAFVLMPTGTAIFASIALLPLLDIVRADLSHRLVPDRAILALACLGAGVAAFSNTGAFTSFVFAATRAAAVASAAISLSYIVSKASRIEGKCMSSSLIGSGDIAVLAIAGLWLPLAAWSAAVVVSVMAATLVVLKCRDRYPDGMRAEVPFAAFLALASYAVALASSSQGYARW